VKKLYSEAINSVDLSRKKHTFIQSLVVSKISGFVA